MTFPLHKLGLSFQSLNRTLNNVVLCFAADIHKVSAVSRYADNNFLILFGFSLGAPQGLIGHAVELDVIQSEIVPGVHIRFPERVSFLPGKLGGG